MKLTQNRPASRIAGQVVDDLAGQTRIIGGSSETDANEFAAIPVGIPSSPNAVSTVTPVGRWASTRRYSAAVILLSSVTGESASEVRIDCVQSVLLELIGRGEVDGASQRGSRRCESRSPTPTTERPQIVSARMLWRGT